MSLFLVLLAAGDGKRLKSNTPKPYNIVNNKKKMLTVPFDQQPVDAVSAYLKTNDGLEFLKVLEKKLVTE